MKKLNTSSKTKTTKETKKTKTASKAKEAKEIKEVKKIEETKETKKVETIKEVVLGIVVPYYKNNEQSELAFKRLFGELKKQLTKDMILFIFEDGQSSDWLKESVSDNVVVKSSSKNMGVSYARNQGIEYLKNRAKYILFIDSDDIVESNYLPKMWEYCADNTHEIIESTFLVNGSQAAFDRNVVRSGVAGSAIQTKIIGDIRFDEDLQIGEDTKFMHEVCDLTKYRKKHAPTQYIYQYGINNESLTKRFERKEIERNR